MNKIFAEYKVKPEQIEAYRAWMWNKTAHDPNFELYEGTDQPGLFVEIWEGYSYEQYQRFKEERINGSSEWAELSNYVQGGLGKIHIWHFTKA